MTGPRPTPLLAVKNLSVGFQSAGRTVSIASAIDLDIAAGEAVALVGESGSGKSTVAGAVLDLLTPGLQVQSGEIVYDGRDLRRLDATARRRMLGAEIGAVFQDPFTSLNPAIRVGEQIAEPLRVHRGVSAAQSLEMARALLADVGIPDPALTARAYQHQLSGGMRQRALIAMALACDPRLLVLDEPTTALDAEVEAQFLALLERLRRQRGLSLLFISHNLAVVRRVCDRVAVLYAGEIIETGPTDAVLSRPSHPYTRALLDCVPRLRPTVRQRLRPIPGNLPLLTDRADGCRFAPRCAAVRPGCETPQAMQSSPTGEVRCWRAADAALDATAPVDVAGRPPATGGGAVLVQAEQLSKSYPKGSLWSALRRSPSGFGLRIERQRFDAVKAMTLELRRGEILGLVGQSGSGKSSFGRMLLRIDEPTSGRIVFDGADITDRPQSSLRDFRRRAQMVFQNPDSSLNPRIAVGDVLARPLRLFGIATGAETDREVDRLLDMIRLPSSYRSRFAHELSGGEKQRIGIARALATRPELIVCDEPVSALDVSVQAAIVNLIEDLRDELGLSVLFISHDIAVVGHLCDRIAVMYRGELCELGPSAEVLAAPTHPYTRSLLAAVQHLDAAPPRGGDPASALTAGATA